MGNQVCLDLRNSSSVLLTMFACVYKGMLEIHTPGLVRVCYGYTVCTLTSTMSLPEGGLFYNASIYEHTLPLALLFCLSSLKMPWEILSGPQWCNSTEV